MRRSPPARSSPRKPAHTTGGLPRKVLRIGDWSGTDVTYFDEVGIKHALVPGIYVFRKRPEVYFSLFARTKAALATLRREWPQRAAAFREYDTVFTSAAFWRQHLGIDEPEPESIPVEPSQEEESDPAPTEVPLALRTVP